MFKQKLATLMAATLMFANVQPTEGIVEHFTNDDSIRAYTLDDKDCSCVISGEVCDIYHLSKAECENMDKYTLYLVDVSASTNDVMQQTSREILSGLIKGQTKDCKAAIVTFSSEIEIYSEYTSDRFDLSRAAEEIEFSKNNTNLYSSIKYAVENVSSTCGNDYGRVIVISDGLDVNKTGITYYELEDSLKENNIQVFTVGLDTGKSANGIKNLAAIARLTGAAGYIINFESDISSICDEINGYISSLNAFDITIPEDLRDGSMRRLVLNNGMVDMGVDVRMPMRLKEVTQATETEVTTYTATEGTETEAGNNTNATDNSIVIIISVSALVVLLIAVIVSFLIRRKTMSNGDKKDSKDTSHSEEPESNSTVYVNPNADVDDNKDKTAVIFPKVTISIEDIDSKKTLFEGSFEKGDLTISREKKPEIKGQVLIINDKSVSRPHCRLYTSGGDLYVVNESSTNPLHINGKEAHEPTLVPDGAVLRLGKKHLRIIIE